MNVAHANHHGKPSRGLACRPEITARCPGVASERRSEPEPASGIRMLVFTSLFPNITRPRYGVFVEERLWYFVATGNVAAALELYRRVLDATSRSVSA